MRKAMCGLPPPVSNLRRRVDAGEAPRRPQIPTRCRRLVVAANVDAVAVPKKARNHQALVAPRPEAQVVAAEARRPVLRMRTC